jgi:RHS repeat-associated protein
MLWDRTTPIPTILADATRLYIYGPDSIPIEQVTPGGTITYYHADALGSIRGLTDKNGRPIGLYNYDPYGNRATVKATSIVAPFGYAGQYTDPTTGLIYMRARYYDPQTAQFLTRDPLGFASGSQNPYAYTNNDPTNLTDPTGLSGCNPQEVANALRRLSDQNAINIAQATARAGSSGSIATADFELAQLDAETATTTEEALAVIRCGSQGSTGRNVPQNLKEQLALEAAKSNPAAGTRIPITMSDPRWPAYDGWVKMSQNINGIEIHYVYNTNNGAADDFKFK